MKASILGFLAFWSLGLAQLASGQAITAFSVPSAGGIVSGPDGNLWFGEYGPSLGRITVGGVVTQTTIPSNPSMVGNLVFDSGGNLWFIEVYNNCAGGECETRIGRLAPTGGITEFPIPSGAAGSNLVLGSDLNIWFATIPATCCTSSIYKISPSGSLSGYPLSSIVSWITAGPDGNLWFTEATNRIGRISPGGTMTEFSAPGTLYGNLGLIMAGSDGALWFTEQTGKIGRITTTGVVSEFALPLHVSGMTSGPDGAIWFTEGASQEYHFPFPPPPSPHKVGRITLDGTIVEISLPSTANPAGITTGPDGNLWVTAGTLIYRIVPPGATCVGDANSMCLGAGRFRVSTTWQSPTAPGVGTSNLLTSNTGAFWFFDPSNLELVVKVLDGRSINGKWWVFYGSLTNVEFTLTVTDTQTGAVKTYVNPQGQLASVADTSAF